MLQKSDEEEEENLEETKDYQESEDIMGNSAKEEMSKAVPEEPSEDIEAVEVTA